MTEDAGSHPPLERPLTVDTLFSPNGAIEVDVLPEAGARLHRLRIDGHDLLRTPDDPAEHLRRPAFWGSYVMAPWVNRLQPGVFTVSGADLVLTSNFPDGSAIHGQVLWRPWSRVGAGRYAVRCGGDGWPWPYQVTEAVTVDDAGVRVVLELTNHSTGSMPAGLGIHPWFRRPLDVAIAAASVHPSNSATDASPVPVAGPFDRRVLEPMPRGLDATWADVGDPAAVLGFPALGLRLTMRIDAPTVYVCAASPSDIDADAVEPQTHAPDGLRRLLRGEPGAMTLLEPGASLRLAIDLRVERVAEAVPATR